MKLFMSTNAVHVQHGRYQSLFDDMDEDQDRNIQWIIYLGMDRNDRIQEKIFMRELLSGAL